MKHKSWIKNYERNFEQLAEEIGDLRYDALSDFLELLANKIEQDGQKDKNRGRKQLANHLQKSAFAIAESSKNIKKAWEICAPYMLPKDISERIKTDFKTADQAKTALKLILDFSNNWEYNDENNRLARCIVYISKGELNRLEENIKAANRDFRDVIVCAEYDSQMNWLRNFNRPFGEENITQEDLDNDNYTPSDDDGEPF